MLRAPNEAVIHVEVRPSSRQGWPGTGTQQGQESDGERAGRRAESGAVGGRKQLAVQEGVVMGTNRRRRRREYKKSLFLHRYTASYSAKITLGFQRNIQINFDPLRYLF